MMHANRSAALVVGCLFGVIASSAMAQDWPQWRGPIAMRRPPPLPRRRRGQGRWNKNGKRRSAWAWPRRPWSVTGSMSSPARRQRSDLLPGRGHGQRAMARRLSGPGPTGRQRSIPDRGLRRPWPMVRLSRSAFVARSRASTRPAEKNSGARMISPTRQVLRRQLSLLIDACASPSLAERTTAASSPTTWPARAKMEMDRRRPSYASPVIMTLGEQKLLIAETDQNIVALRLADGKEAWKAAFAATAWASTTRPPGRRRPDPHLLRRPARDVCHQD